MVYLSRGSRFIAIQERVDILTGDGVEMTPFHNISKEWYAAQTSKKIRAVWQAKADNGRRVSSAVPFGHMKDPNDKEKWPPKQYVKSTRFALPGAVRRRSQDSWRKSKSLL